jgi:hypothetical protein
MAFLNQFVFVDKNLEEPTTHPQLVETIEPKDKTISSTPTCLSIGKQNQSIDNSFKRQQLEVQIIGNQSIPQIDQPPYTNENVKFSEFSL